MKVGKIFYILIVCMLSGGVLSFPPTVVLAWATLPLAFIYTLQSMSRKHYLIISFFIILFFSLVLGLIFNVRAALYFLFDFLAIFVTIYLFKYAKIIRYFEFVEISYLFFFYAGLYLTLYYFGFDKGVDRYSGPLLNVNLSAYVFGYSVLFIFIKMIWRGGVLYMSAVAALTLIIIVVVGSVSGSRSVMLFAVALFVIYIYEIFKKLSNRVALSGLFLGLCVVWLVISFSSNGERFDTEETSFLTRTAISAELVGKIIESKGVPQGVRYSVDYIVSEYGNPDMHPHNDLISGVLDYGFIYAILIAIMCRIWLKRFGMDFVSCSLMIVYISTALHGYFSSLLLLFPAFLLSEYYRAWQLKT